MTRQKSLLGWLEASLEPAKIVTEFLAGAPLTNKTLVTGAGPGSNQSMNKRIMILVADGAIYQRGKALNLPSCINEDDAKHLHVADIGLFLPESAENFFQVIALPVPGSQFAAADKAIVVDVPERKSDLVMYDTSATEAKQWIRDQIEYDRRKAEEDAREEDEEDEDEEQEDEDDDNQREPESSEQQDQPPEPPAPVPQIQAAFLPPQLPAAEVLAPIPLVAALAPEPSGQLETLEPLPLELPTGDKEP